MPDHGDDDDESYEVGYGKPPKHTRFQKGRSGNPKGRKRGGRNFSTDVSELLSSKVSVNVDGHQQTIDTRRAALLKLKEKALKGDIRALDKLLGFAAEMSLEATANSKEKQLQKNDKAILERFKQATESGTGGDD